MLLVKENSGPLHASCSHGLSSLFNSFPLVYSKQSGQYDSYPFPLFFKTNHILFHHLTKTPNHKHIEQDIWVGLRYRLQCFCRDSIQPWNFLILQYTHCHLKFLNGMSGKGMSEFMNSYLFYVLIG